MSRHHPCHALGCERQVPPRMHMCGPHWGMVPRATRLRLWATYREGQENDMQPSADYLHAAAACVRTVAEAEGHASSAIDAECSTYETWASMLETPEADS